MNRIYRYLVTVDLESSSEVTSDTIRDEIDSNLESVIADYGIAHFAVEPLSTEYYQNANRPIDYRERVIRSNEQ